MILIVILAAFGLILWTTSLVGQTFGKTGEVIALGVVAVVLLIGFIKTKGDK